MNVHSIVSRSVYQYSHAIPPPKIPLRFSSYLYVTPRGRNGKGGYLDQSTLTLPSISATTPNRKTKQKRLAFFGRNINQSPPPPFFFSLEEIWLLSPTNHQRANKNTKQNKPPLNKELRGVDYGLTVDRGTQASTTRSYPPVFCCPPKRSNVCLSVQYNSYRREIDRCRVYSSQCHPVSFGL